MHGFDFKQEIYFRISVHLHLAYLSYYVLIKLNNIFPQPFNLRILTTLSIYIFFFAIINTLVQQGGGAYNIE